MSRQCSSQVRLADVQADFELHCMYMAVYSVVKEFHSKALDCLIFWKICNATTVYTVIRHAKKGLRTCADSVAPDQTAHPRSLIWKLHCPLINQCNPLLQKSGQCISQIRLHRCAGWSGVTLSAYLKGSFSHVLSDIIATTVRGVADFLAYVSSTASDQPFMSVQSDLWLGPYNAKNYIYVWK